LPWLAKKTRTACLVERVGFATTETIRCGRIAVKKLSFCRDDYFRLRRTPCAAITYR
jgi:hypothetical protein